MRQQPPNLNINQNGDKVMSNKINDQRKDHLFLNFPIEYIPRILRLDEENANWGERIELIQDIINYSLINTTKKDELQSEFSDFFSNSQFYNPITNPQKIPQNKNYKSKVVTGISIEMFYKNLLLDLRTKERTYNTVLLCSFLALKSIIGNKKAVKTNKTLFFSRFCGFDKPQKNIEGNELIKKYFPSGRYSFRKVRNDLKSNWRLKYIGERGFYFSFTEPLSVIQKIILQHNKKYQKRIEKEEIKEAKAEAVKMIVTENIIKKRVDKKRTPGTNNVGDLMKKLL